MGNKKEKNSFMPEVAIPPGETIRENMDYLGLSQEELAARLGITQKHLSNIFNGNSPITYETALSLEKVIGPRADFWMNLEINYQLNKTRLEEQDNLDKELDILKEIPYKEMSELGWVDKTRSRKERVINCRAFFGVAKLYFAKASCGVSFRKHKESNEISDYGVLAWLRKAELEALSIEADKFNKRKLKSLIPTFRKLTLKPPDEFYPELKELCAKCGVCLVLVESLPKTYVCGATIWKKGKVVLALSVRGKRADIFWFTFFHELAHIINHSKKELHISYENEKSEDEANKIANNYLIPEELYKEFINNYPYDDKGVIVDYAHKIGIAPSILVGRLLHDRLIEYKFYSDLRPSFEIVREDDSG